MLHIRTSLSLLVITVLLVPSAMAQDEAAKAEIAKWQGTWRMISMENDGKISPPEKLKGIKLTVQDSTYHFQNDDFSERGKYQFDPSMEPKTLDIVVDEGKDRGKIYRVIYKVAGDELTICLRSDNKQRPIEFSGKAGSGQVLEVWKREK